MYLYLYIYIYVYFFYICIIFYEHTSKMLKKDFYLAPTTVPPIVADVDYSSGCSWMCFKSDSCDPTKPFKRCTVCICIYIYIPGTQMSLVLIGQDIVLEAKQRTNGFQVYIHILNIFADYLHIYK